MALGADRYASRGDTFAFLGCVVLSVVAMSLPQRIRDPLARGLRETVLAPFLALQQHTERLSASLARYDAVVAQRDSAALAATFLPELRGENARLRGLLGLGTRLSSGSVPRRVLPGAGPVKPPHLHRLRPEKTGGEAPVRSPLPRRAGRDRERGR